MIPQQEILKILNYFKGREGDLKQITRFSLYKVMFYRTNLWNHSRRVSWLVEEMKPYARAVFQEAYDPDKAYALALVHDDAEILTGDVQAGNKSKMSVAELAAIDEQEHEAIETLAERFPPKVGPYLYKDLLTDALTKESLEAQVVMLVDKLDAFGETLHEIFAGNQCFVTNVVNHYGTIPLPSDYYITYLSTVTQRYPALEQLFHQRSWLFAQPETCDFKAVCQHAKLHTEQSIQQETGYPHYDGWKRVILTHGTPPELAELYTRKEPAE